MNDLLRLNIKFWSLLVIIIGVIFLWIFLIGCKHRLPDNQNLRNVNMYSHSSDTKTPKAHKGKCKVKGKEVKKDKK